MLLHRKLEHMQFQLGKDFEAYRDLFRPFIQNWDKLADDVLAPLHFPKEPLLMGKFGSKALRTAEAISKRFRQTGTRDLGRRSRPLYR